MSKLNKLLGTGGGNVYRVLLLDHERHSEDRGGRPAFLDPEPWCFSRQQSTGGAPAGSVHRCSGKARSIDSARVCPCSLSLPHCSGPVTAHCCPCGDSRRSQEDIPRVQGLWSRACYPCHQGESSLFCVHSAASHAVSSSCPFSSYWEPQQAFCLQLKKLSASALHPGMVRLLSCRSMQNSMPNQWQCRG